jgi:hypothetical protein
VFDIIEADFLPKPEPAAYRRLLERFRLCAGTTALFEDIPRNLVAAAEMGMTTIWVRNHTRWAEEAESHDHIHHVTDDLTGWIRRSGGGPRPARRSAGLVPLCQGVDRESPLPHVPTFFSVSFRLGIFMTYSNLQKTHRRCLGITPGNRYLHQG